MDTYHKINTIYKRDPETKNKHLLFGEFSQPEFEYLQDNTWDFTEKVDGTNIRIQLDVEGKLSFGGKTDTAQIPATLVNVLRERFSVDRLVDKFPCVIYSPNPEDPDPVPVCLYGEGYGAKIQKGGGKYRPDQSFVLFDVKVGDWWLRRDDVADVANTLQIEHVPLIGQGTLWDMVDMCRNGFTSQWGNFDAEGIVARPTVEIQDRAGRRIITKLKLKDFAR